MERKERTENERKAINKNEKESTSPLWMCVTSIGQSMSSIPFCRWNSLVGCYFKNRTNDTFVSALSTACSVADSFVPSIPISNTNIEFVLRIIYIYPTGRTFISRRFSFLFSKTGLLIEDEVGLAHLYFSFWYSYSTFSIHFLLVLNVFIAFMLR